MEDRRVSGRARQVERQTSGGGEYARDGVRNGLAAPCAGHVRLQDCGGVVIDPLARQRPPVRVHHGGARVFRNHGARQRLLCAGQVE